MFMASSIDWNSLTTTKPPTKPSADTPPGTCSLRSLRSLRSHPPGGCAPHSLRSLRWPRLRRGPGGRSPPTLAGSGTNVAASPFDSARGPIRQSGREPHPSPTACGAHFVALLSPRALAPSDARRGCSRPEAARERRAPLASARQLDWREEHTPAERLRRPTHQLLSARSAWRAVRPRARATRGRAGPPRASTLHLLADSKGERSRSLPADVSTEARATRARGAQRGPERSRARGLRRQFRCDRRRERARGLR